MVQSADDILRELNSFQYACASSNITPQTLPDRQKTVKQIKTPPSARLPLTPEINLTSDEQKIIEILAREEKMHIDRLAQTLNWPAHKLSQLLIELEIKGIVKRQPGMYYST